MPWEHSESPAELALEKQVLALARRGRAAYVAAAAAAARAAYPVAIARAGKQAMSLGYHEKAKSFDGASEGMKIRRVEEWLAAPGAKTLAAVEQAIDPTRQLEIWNDDLRPRKKEDRWMWFGCVGQLAAQAVVHPEQGRARDRDSSYQWPAPVCAARCVVAAAKVVGDAKVIRAALAGLLLVALLGACGAVARPERCGEPASGSELITDATDPELVELTRRCAGGTSIDCTPMCLELIERTEGAPLHDGRVLVECYLDDTPAEAAGRGTVARWSHEAKCID